MFLKRKHVATAHVSPEDVREGDMFERESSGRVIEHACVQRVYSDRDGIPHVRYELSYRRANQVDHEGTRILALPVFVERYRTLGSG